MKIKVNEARSNKVMKVGPIKIDIPEAEGSARKPASVNITLITPLKDRFGYGWFVENVDLALLKRKPLDTILKRMYRIAIRTQLIHSDDLNEYGIAADKYSYRRLADWEEEMLADKAGIDAVEAEIRQRIEDFKPEG